MVAEAIPKTWKAKADYDFAKKAKSNDVDALASALAQARRDARDAEQALQKHIEEHKCGR